VLIPKIEITSCCLGPLYAPDRCLHRQRFLDAEEYVISKGIRISHPDHEFFAWKAGRSGKYGHDRYIELSSAAYKIFGWDVMASVLTHEFGHCDLFLEGIGEGSTDEENLEIEKKANQRGLDIMPASLVPGDYQDHRAFFLRSYMDILQGIIWTERKCLEEWSKTVALSG
jgi:hypothetical protein